MGSLICGTQGTAEAEGCSVSPADLRLPWGRESLDHSAMPICLLACLFLPEIRLDKLLSLFPRATLQTWKVILQRRAGSKGLVNVRPEKQSSQWHVFRHESIYTISDLKMSLASFRGNALIYKSENLTHRSYLWFKFGVTAGELDPASTVLTSLRKRGICETYSLNVRGNTSLGHECTH